MTVVFHHHSDGQLYNKAVAPKNRKCLLGLLYVCCILGLLAQKLGVLTEDILLYSKFGACLGQKFSL